MPVIPYLSTTADGNVLVAAKAPKLAPDGEVAVTEVTAVAVSATVNWKIMSSPCPAFVDAGRDDVCPSGYIGVSAVMVGAVVSRIIVVETLSVKPLASVNATSIRLDPSTKDTLGIENVGVSATNDVILVSGAAFELRNTLSIDGFDST